MSFKEDHVVVLSGMKFFLPPIANPAIYANTLKFQGSDDGETYTDIVEIGD
jgi:hypothetical protein